MKKIFLLAMLVASSFAASSHGKETINPEPLENFSMVRDERAPGMVALAAMYSPFENKDHWIKFVCAGMTDGGCEFFKSNYADAIWESPVGHDGVSSGGFVADTTIINDTAQVWKMEMTIFSRSGEIKSDVLVLVELGSDGNWYLNRVLHGPWLPPRRCAYGIWKKLRK